MSPLSITKSFLELNRLDFRLLSVIEILMAKHEFVPIEEIVRFTKYNTKKIEITLKRLRKMKLIYLAQKHYLGAALTFIGYDALGLKALVEKNVLAQLGPEIGAGKESNVHLGMNDHGEEFLIKIHRLGKLDFRATRRSRTFIAEKRHLSPLYQSRLSAEREYNALNALYTNGVSVPKPIAQNRHLIMMEIILGQDLFRIKRSDFGGEEEIAILFQNIVQEVKKCVQHGYIHGDLSEYNIRLNEDDFPVLIDWPQYLDTNEPRAVEILTRDCQNIMNFFEKKFMVKIHYEISEILKMLD